MTLADQRRKQSVFVDKQDGETVGYRHGDELSFRSIIVRVRYDPLSVEGEVLKDTVEISVSKQTLPSVQVKRDDVRLDSKRDIGEPAPTFRVQEILEGRDPGASRWVLRCAKL